MSGLIEGTVWVPSAVIAASLLGSAHCMGMCGPLVVSSCKSGRDILNYHFGRLLSYSALGAIAGAFGRNVLKNPFFPWLPWIGSVLMAAGFIFMGIQIWRKGTPHFGLLPGKWVMSLFSRFRNSAGALGALSALLPCGWLQGFILGAAATQSPWRGALFMAVFWLGTMPAMASAPFMIQGPLKRFSSRLPRLSAMLLILIGLSGIGLKMSQIFSPAAQAHCQMHSHLDSP